jgi:hypothetical protein
VRAAAFVADPAGDPDRKPEPEVALKLGDVAGEAMSDARPERPVFPQDRGKVPVCIALVEEHRLADAACKIQLAVERLLLYLARGEVTEVIKSALTHGHDLRIAGKLGKFAQASRGQLARVVRVHAGGCKQHPGVCAAQRDRLGRACKRGAGDDHLRDTGGARPFHYRIAIGSVTVMRQVDADVDEGCDGGGGARRRSCVMVRHVRSFYRNRRILGPGLGLALVGVMLAGAARADDGQWRDTESRIQYGYYTQDTRSLANVAAALDAQERKDQWQGYYAGLANWRLAELAALHPSGKPPTVAQLAERCAHAVDGVLEQQPDFAEGLALRAVCVATPLAGGGMHVPFAGHGPRKDLDRALALAPKSPRVLLLDALGDYEFSSALGGNKERALPKLRRAVAAFEAERGGAEGLPGWGASEAYYYLGRDLLEHGDPVGARDALEHALLLAPEYAQARALMAKITAG